MIQNLYFWLVLASISLTNEMFITRLKKKKTQYSLFNYIGSLEIGVVSWMMTNFPPCKDVHLDPQNITKFGTRAFADVIKIGISKWDHPGLG